MNTAVQSARPPRVRRTHWLLIVAFGCSDGEGASDSATSTLPVCPVVEAVPPRAATPLPPPPTLPTPYAADTGLSRYFERESLGTPRLAPIDDDAEYPNAAELLYLSGKGIEDAVGWDFMVTATLG